MKRIAILLFVCISLFSILLLVITAITYEQSVEIKGCERHASTKASYAMNNLLSINQQEVTYMGLTETKESYEEEILSRDGVLGIGVGRDSIVVYVDADKEITPPIPMTLDEWPVVLIPTEPFEIV